MKLIPSDIERYNESYLGHSAAGIESLVITPTPTIYAAENKRME